MSLLKPIENGRMYEGWHRWNPIGGCEHGCSYCYMKAMEKRFGKDMTTPVFREDFLDDNLGKGRKIFVCSSGDMWGTWVLDMDIQSVLEHCRKYPENEYMFLTKNPARYMEFLSDGFFPKNSILGATIEGWIWDCMSGRTSAPSFGARMNAMAGIRRRWPATKLMVSIEPVIGVQLGRWFADEIERIAPDIVYIGVDSGKNGLPEPTADELRGLIVELREFADVRLKNGIERILPECK